MKKVTVIGSLNMDESIYLKELPKEGETVFSTQSGSNPGGKGLNQAVALKRLGNEVHFIGGIGNDATGKELEKILQEEGISTKFLQVTESVTGKAWIAIADSGQNNIIVNSGANFAFSESVILEAKKVIENSDVVLAQLEVPQDIIIKGFEIAKKAGKLTVLNPAPVQEISERLLSLTDILIPNEIEIAPYTGETNLRHDKEIYKKTKALFTLGIQFIVITLGERGVISYNAHGETFSIPASQVRAVDATAAGDSFIAAFIHYYDDMITEQAIFNANQFAGMTVQKKGAYQAIPTIELFEKYKKDKGL